MPSLALDLAELGLDLLSREGVVGCQIDQVRLLIVEFSKLGGQLLVEQARGGFLFLDDGVDLGANFVDEWLAEADGGVVAFHGVLDQFDVDVGRVAAMGLPAAAEEVQVFDTF